LGTPDSTHSSFRTFSAFSENIHQTKPSIAVSSIFYIYHAKEQVNNCFIRFKKVTGEDKEGINAKTHLSKNIYTSMR